jgi:ABC-type multidrug transport system fused ATPase/permease subunit
VRQAQQHADYAYRLAVDPPAAKEVRLFGLGPWVLERFRARRRELHTLQYEATRLRERSVLAALAVVGAGNALVFWALGNDALDGELSVARTVVFLQAALGASAVAFGGLNWALDGAAAPVAAVARIEAALAPAVRAAPAVAPTPAPTGTAAPEIRFRSVHFAYPGGGAAVLDGFDLTIPAGTSMAIVGVNGAGKTTAAKLLCRLYDPQDGGIEIDGVDLRRLPIEQWRSRLSAVFQDFVRLEWTLRDNVDPAGRITDPSVVQQALRDAGAAQLSELDTILAKGYPGGTDLSGGQWQRVALARALASVVAGARVVLLDEPTAQLDVRGEAEIFERVLDATRHCTTILVSHRFQTVRRADRICVLEGGRVAELGTHDQLMALGGRYRTMFDLQASRFVERDEATGEELVYERLD